MKTVVGVFATMAEAERVEEGLRTLGIPDSDINIVAGDEKKQHSSHYGSKMNEEHHAEGSTAASAGSGAAIGGGLGLVAGLVALAIPGVGPIVAGGALATALTGLGVGAAAGGLIGAFTEMGVSDTDAPVYEEAVRRGHIVISAKVKDSMEHEVSGLMDQYGARDVNSEADVWRASGWAGPAMGGPMYDPALQPYGLTPDVTSTPTYREPQTHRYATRARSYPVEAPGTEGTPKREATSPLDLSSIPEGQVTEHFPVRHEAVHLSSDPAWIFGNRWASDPNYAGRGWSDVESNLRSSWESTHAGSWDGYRDRVRRGFEKEEGGAEDPLANVDLSSRSGQRGF